MFEVVYVESSVGETLLAFLQVTMQEQEMLVLVEMEQNSTLVTEETVHIIQHSLLNRVEIYAQHFMWIEMALPWFMRD